MDTNRYFNTSAQQSPDEGYYYGLNTTVLGFLMERATGKSLQTLLEERVLEPYDIEGLSFFFPSLLSCHPEYRVLTVSFVWPRPWSSTFLGSPAALRQRHDTFPGW